MSSQAAAQWPQCTSAHQQLQANRVQTGSQKIICSNNKIFHIFKLQCDNKQCIWEKTHNFSRLEETNHLLSVGTTFNQHLQDTLMISFGSEQWQGHRVIPNPGFYNLFHGKSQRFSFKAKISPFCVRTLLGNVIGNPVEILKLGSDGRYWLIWLAHKEAQYSKVTYSWQSRWLWYQRHGLSAL